MKTLSEISEISEIEKLLKVGNIFKVNHHYDNYYFKITSIDMSLLDGAKYTFLQCDVFGGAVRCPEKQICSAWQFCNNFENGWWSVVRGTLGGDTEPKKVVSIAQKRKLLEIAKSIGKLKSSIKSENKLLL